MTYTVEITNDESIILNYALGLAQAAIDGLSYDSKTTITDVDKISLQDAIDYLSAVVGARDKMIEDAGFNDVDKTKRLLKGLHEKITPLMNTEK